MGAHQRPRGCLLAAAGRQPLLLLPRHARTQPHGLRARGAPAHPRGEGGEEWGEFFLRIFPHSGALLSEGKAVLYVYAIVSVYESFPNESR